MPNSLQLDPNVPWKQRFRAPAVLWTQLAKAAPTRGLAVSNQSGKYQLYAWDLPTGALRQVTDRPTGVMFGALAPDGRWLYYLDDQAGNEIGHYVRVPFAGGEPQDLTPTLPPYSSLSFGASLAGNRIGFMIANTEGFHFCCLDVGMGETLGAPRLLYHSRKLVRDPVFSYGGELAVLASTERAALLHTHLIAIDATTGDQITELWDGPATSVIAVAFAPQPDDCRLLGTTNRTGDRRPLIWNPRTSERIDLALGELEGEALPLDWSPDAQHILLCQIHQAVQQLYVYHLADHTLTRLAHPRGTFGFFAGLFTYFGPGGEIFAQWQDAAHPSHLIALNRQTGEVERTLLAAGAVSPGRPWQSVHFPSSDGQLIQGWLSVPEGVGPFSTILEVHGGPELVMTEIFSPRAQAWLDHGFAYLTINYRGSTTFGQAFQEKIWGDLGAWEVEDMTAAHAWLVQRAIAHPDQILLSGGSYGGYLTLLGLGKRPDLWAGGLAVIAIADWTASYEDAADTLRGYQVALLGGTPQEKPEQYAASSPITYAENVRAPVQIIQGRHDSRTPARSVELYEAKMKALGKPIEVHWFDAGHFGAGVELEIACQELMLRFAYRTLGLAT